MTRLAPRIRQHKNGTATVSGIPFHILTHILTGASLHCYDFEEEAKGKPNEAERRQYTQPQQKIIKLLDAQWKGYNPDYRHRPVSQLSKSDLYFRKRDVLMARDQRKEVERIMASIHKWKRS